MPTQAPLYGLMAEYDEPEELLHATQRAFTVRCDHIVAIRRCAKTGYLSNNRCTTSNGMIQGFENNDTRPARDNKAISVSIKWARRFGWVVIIARGQRPHRVKQ